LKCAVAKYVDEQ